MTSLTDPTGDLRQAVRPVLNRDREEVRVPHPHGEAVLAYLTRRGVRGTLRSDPAGDVIALLGEPDMGRVYLRLTEWAAAPAAPHN